MIINGLQAEDIRSLMRRRCPDVDNALSQALFRLHKTKQQIATHQAAALYALAHSFNFDGSNILEIGTYYGYSAAILAQAAPLANIVTLNPNEDEWKLASEKLEQYKNVRAVCLPSWDYLATYDGPDLDFIFVDGDHKHVKRDRPWFNWLATGGIILYHDYTPLGAPRHCPPVYDAVNDFTLWIGRKPDVLIVDDNRLGMAGWRKMPGDGMYRCPDRD